MCLAGSSVGRGVERKRWKKRRMVLTGLVGKDEMIFSIDSCRSGYISARRTSRSVGGGKYELA